MTSKGKEIDEDNWEIDVAVPSLNLAFEYQGEQHYESNQLYGEVLSVFSFFFILFKSESVKKKDSRKLDLCKEEGITLIQVPYWWDGGLE